MTDRVYHAKIDRHTTVQGALAALEQRNLGSVKVRLSELEVAFSSMSKRDNQNMEEYFEMGQDLQYNLERCGNVGATYPLGMGLWEIMQRCHVAQRTQFLHCDTLSCIYTNNLSLLCALCAAQQSIHTFCNDHMVTSYGHPGHWPQMMKYYLTFTKSLNVCVLALSLSASPTGLRGLMGACTYLRLPHYLVAEAGV